MRILKMENLLVCTSITLSFLLFSTSCINDKYDINKDIDLTMGLGSEGLELKIGNTAPIMLSEILKTNDSFHTDKTNNFYLEESGTTNFLVDIPSISTTLDEKLMHPQIRLFDFESIGGNDLVSSIPFPSGEIALKGIKGSDRMNFIANDIPQIIKCLQEIYPKDGKMRLKINFVSNRPEIKLRFKKVSNLKVYFPSFINLDANGNNVANINNWTGNSSAVDLGTVHFNSVRPNGESGLVIENGSMELDGKISMDGDFTVEAENSFQITPGDYIDLVLTATVDGSTSGEVSIAKVRGIFDPEINPQINTIDISNNLPDFLKDSEVVIKVSNPTINFNADMTDIPLNLNFSATLSANLKGKRTTEVRFPQSGSVMIDNSTQNAIYFYQSNAGPYSPTDIPAYAKKSQVSNISSLIEKIPDYIDADLANGHIRAAQELAVVELGRNYQANIDYHIYIPLEFNNGLKIVYNDTIADLNKDLYKYQADGIVITADILNTVPLDLNVSMIAVDVNGKEINEINIFDAVVKAGIPEGVNSQITLDAVFSNPEDLSRIDKLLFRVDADANIPDGSQASLLSTQYIQVKNMRLKLKGQVIGNFN